jgi:hypothetical protein
MTIATVSVNGNDYQVYADLEFADEYLGGDVARADNWEALDEDPDQGRALVTATRLLQRQSWRDGVPSLDDPPLIVQQATALLAADISAKPALGDSGSTGSNVKSVGAGSAKVEFFRPTAGTPLPQAAYDLLGDLLGPPTGAATDPSLDGTAYGSEFWRHSRFPPDGCSPYHYLAPELWG